MSLTRCMYIYIYVILFAQLQCMRVCVCFLLITEIIKISLLCIIADFSSVCSGLPIYELVLLDWVFKWQASSELHCSTYKNTYIYIRIYASYNMLQYSIFIINYIYCISIAYIREFRLLSIVQKLYSAATARLHKLSMLVNSALLARRKSFLLTCKLLCSSLAQNSLLILRFEAD